MKLADELRKIGLTEKQVRQVVDLAKQWALLIITNSMHKVDIEDKAFNNKWNSQELNYPKIFDAIQKKIKDE